MSLDSGLVQELLERAREAGTAFVNGDALPYAEIATTADDFAIFGPFGGPALLGGSAFRAASARVAAQFAHGVCTIEPVAAYASGDLAVLVMVERQTCQIAGRPEQDWSLRITLVFRREGSGWKVVHRHADPLTRRRTVAEAAQLSA